MQSQTSSSSQISPVDRDIEESVSHTTESCEMIATEINNFTKL